MTMKALQEAKFKRRAQVWAGAILVGGVHDLASHAVGGFESLGHNVTQAVVILAAGILIWSFQKRIN